MHCPRRDEWLRRLDGEVMANRLVELDAHLAGCTSCRREATKLDDMAGALRAPMIGVPADTVTRVLARLDDATPAPRRRWPWALGTLAAAAAAAAAAAVALVLALPTREGSDFQARGHVARDLTRQAGIEIYALGSELRPLADGSQVTRDTAYVASYRNLRDVPAHALVFAIDAAREVHWLYPAFSDAATDPAAVILASTQAPVLFTDSVVLDDVALGELTLVTVISDAALHVSAVEQLPRDARTRHVLRARWPDAVVHMTRVDVER
jgi:hypothetical protein